MTTPYRIYLCYKLISFCRFSKHNFPSWQKTYVQLSIWFIDYFMNYIIQYLHLVPSRRAVSPRWKAIALYTFVLITLDLQLHVV